MDIEYIKRFVVVAQCLNFSKAADTMFISQPTLSYSISSLEKKLGTALLVRNTKSVKLTRAGELFLPSAVKIVELYQNVINEIGQEFNLGSDALNIGYIGPAMDNLLSDWIKKFRKLYPEVKVHILRYSSSKVVEAFQNHAIHFGILYEMNLVNLPGLKYQEVGREKFKVLLNSEHPLANCSSIDLKQLKDEPFLICERSCSPNYYDRVFSICEKRDFKPQISQTLGLVGDIYRLVSAGLGVAIMSYSEARSYDAYNVKFVDIDDGQDLINRVVMAWTNNLSPLARKFKDITQETKPKKNQLEMNEGTGSK